LTIAESGNGMNVVGAITTKAHKELKVKGDETYIEAAC
jgi:hypothetical protein